MSEIKLTRIVAEGKQIKYKFNFSDEISRYFRKNELLIEYDNIIDDIPYGVAVIPFVCSVLPIIWLTNSSLYIDEIDSDFFTCIDSVKKGYMSIYSKAQFRGGCS